MGKKSVSNENHFFSRELETLHREDLRALQIKKTKETLERAYNRSDFYRDLFDRAKVKPDDFKSLSDIERFPFINKQDLVRDQEENPPFGRRLCLPLDEVRRVNVTSGTSGMGQEVHCHEEDSIWAANASTASHFAAIGMKDGELSALLYPLGTMTGGRHQPYYHSEHRQVESMRKMHPEPIMQIHPERGEALGIEDGDWVWIESPLGRIKQKCRYFDGIDPRVVHAQHGWWFPEEDGAEPSLHGVWKSNINVLINDDPDGCNRISGGWPLRAMLCKVYKETD